MKTKSPQGGFTLVEMIVAMVITGIIAGMLAVFIAKPVQGYVDTARRAGLTDVADLALKRIGLDLRSAVPNSVRLRTGSASASSCSAPTSATGCFVEFIPGRTGGRYCTDRETGCDALSFTVAGDSFEILGPSVALLLNDDVVIYNTGQSGLDAYAAAPNNRRTVASAMNSGVPVTLNATTAQAVTQITLGSTALTYPSPSNRFQIVPATGPVTFACEGVGGSSNGTGTLKRYGGYGYNPAQAASGLGSGALLADYLSDCRIAYDTVSARNGIVGIRLTITRESESITLIHQIHVDNMP